MFDKLTHMIFFRKKKPEPPKPAFKRTLPTAAVATKEKEPKAVKSLSSIVTQRVLTAEGWRRAMEKKVLKKAK
jgi:hypothetical protein